MSLLDFTLREIIFRFQSSGCTWNSDTIWKLYKFEKCMSDHLYLRKCIDKIRNVLVREWEARKAWGKRENKVETSPTEGERRVRPFESPKRGRGATRHETLTEFSKPRLRFCAGSVSGFYRRLAHDLRHRQLPRVRPRTFSISLSKRIFPYISTHRVLLGIHKSFPRDLPWTLLNTAKLLVLSFFFFQFLVFSSSRKLYGALVNKNVFQLSQKLSHPLGSSVLR